MLKEKQSKSQVKHMNRILVTGAAGFIGSNLLARLLADPSNYVIGVDNFSSGSLANILPFKAMPNFEFHRWDVCLPYSTKDWAQDIEQVYSLACPASPRNYQVDPIQTFKTSVLGAMNALDVAEMNGARILYSSTSEVYGNPLSSPQDEKMWGNVNPIGIRSCYDEGKRGAETLFMDHWRQHNTDIKIIRIFNTYGPNMQVNDGRVISNFIVQALTGKPITIYGDGSQTRSFQYIDDLLDGIELVMRTGRMFTGPVNLGNPSGEMTIKQIAEAVFRCVEEECPGIELPEITYEPLPQDDPTQRCPDITLAKQALGWSPKVSLEDGIKQTVHYFKTVL